MASGNVHLEPGDQVGTFRVVEMLGEGGFGAVYKVQKNEVMYAMKLERRQSNGVLKMEVHVLREVGARNSKHFCRCEESGIHKEAFYLVMTIVGRSLQDIRKDLPQQKFSMGCALSVGIQSFVAIEELHAIGFLHRDLKPSNYAVGKDTPDFNKIYLLDFGMARRFKESNGQIRRPRTAPGFRGTVRYAPLSCHIRREQSAKCDVESWLYQQVELTRGALPWRSFENRDVVGMYKERCRFDIGLREFMGGCPREYVEILRYADALRYYDTPDYNMIVGLLRRAIKTLGVSEYPYDWEPTSKYYREYTVIMEKNRAEEEKRKTQETASKVSKLSMIQ